MNKQILMPAALVFALAGCAGIPSWVPDSRTAPKLAGQTQPRETRDAAACHGTRCRIIVTVRDCVVTVKPYFIVMTHPGPVTMEWQIVDDATFVDGGIRWKEGAADAVFARSKDASERQAVFTNNRTALGVFHYGVTVRQGGRTCPELDPTGIND